MHVAIAAAIFAVTWLLWSGLFKPLVLGLGVLSCALVTLIARRTGFFATDVYALHLTPRLPGFWCWLLKEIAKANFAVARIILLPRLPVEPTIVTLDVSDLDPVSQATLANSITLTPGTLTVDLDRGRLEVHCLTRAMAAQLESGEMLERTRRLTGA